MRERQLPEVLPTAVARSTDDFLNELRSMVFHSNHGDCLTRAELNDLYSVAHGSPMECAQLAHIVSCPSCLDEVNRMIGLPLLSERMPTETLGRDKRAKGPHGGGAAGGGGFGIGNWRRRVRRVFEHKPQELSVAVNGYVQATQTVNSELSELNLNIDLTEDISFIEVFSEQKLRLLLLNVDDLPPAGPGERTQLMEMSDGRTLSLKLEFRSPWPTLNVAYHDPTYKEVEELLAKSDGDESLPFVNDPLVARAQEHAPENRLLKLFAQVRRVFFNRNFWLRPGTVTAVFALIVIGVLLWSRFHANTPPLTATELLQQASQVEQSIAARTDTVFHRMVTVEEYDASSRNLISRHKAESWHNAEKQITARRFFDEKNNLVAGEWDRADGRTFYQHGAKAERRGTDSALTLDNAWSFDLSANEFSSLIGANPTFVEDRAGAYTIAYEGQSTQRLFKATLTLSKADLHATEMTLLIRAVDSKAAGPAASPLREYRFMETSFERHAPTTVAPAVFDPEPELISTKGTPTGNSKLETGAPSTPAVAPLPPTASAELEVEVLSLINQSGADLGDQVNVRRTPEGQLLVRGIVETDKRKDEILRALAPVANNPAVRLKIETEAEALRSQRGGDQKGRITIERLESSSDKIPADAELRRYFTARGFTGAQLDQAVNQFAGRMVDRSLAALRHAGALERLAQRFSLEQLRTLNPEAKSKWLSLLRSHAQALERDLNSLHRELGPFINEAGPGAQIRIESDADLQQTIHRLFELCTTSDQAVRAALTISEGGNSSAIKSSQFSRSLSGAEALANGIGAVAQP